MSSNNVKNSRKLTNKEPDLRKMFEDFKNKKMPRLKLRRLPFNVKGNSLNNSKLFRYNKKERLKSNRPKRGSSNKDRYRD
jgi:hypothetical protein